MTPRTLTRALGAAVVALAVALTVVLLHRPQPPTETATSTVAASSPASSPPNGPSLPPDVSNTASEGGPSDLPTSEVHDHSDASPGSLPYSQTREARRQWQPIVTGFAKAFTATKGRTTEQWRNALNRYATDTVREQLATVDLRKVPDARFTSIEPAEYGDDKVAVFLHYDTGLTLVAYLILDHTSWRVYAYDRWED